jgi:hypothetical protein|tara:strand:- start:641 stop:1090 length:450 start_codon:yes stop_codon:yes gene_type:complete
MYELMWVTHDPKLWSSKDPVRPELGVEFKTAPGRSVCGLLGDDGRWKAFLCYAVTSGIPRDVEELEEMTTEDGRIVIPYTVWSHEKGAGRAIIYEVIKCINELAMGIDRVVTLSPLTKMARKFHLRNNAVELRVNETTVNFEYNCGRPL